MSRGGDRLRMRSKEGMHLLSQVWNRAEPRHRTRKQQRHRLDGMRGRHMANDSVSGAGMKADQMERKRNGCALDQLEASA